MNNEPIERPLDVKTNAGRMAGLHITRYDFETGSITVQIDVPARPITGREALTIFLNVSPRQDVRVSTTGRMQGEADTYLLADVLTEVSAQLSDLAFQMGR